MCAQDVFFDLASKHALCLTKTVHEIHIFDQEATEVTGILVAVLAQAEPEIY